MQELGDFVVHLPCLGISREPHSFLVLKTPRDSITPVETAIPGEKLVRGLSMPGRQLGNAFVFLISGGKIFSWTVVNKQ
jgi:hypothetical protein